tara:strand:+ start:416 stop:670 length:255 start_codon:yes stop_codon:yes gene_type:complete
MIKYRLKVYSDRVVERPEAYFNAVFGSLSSYWDLVPSDLDENFIQCESIALEVDPTNKNELENQFDDITPEMYMSHSRSYVIQN